MQKTAYLSRAAPQQRECSAACQTMGARSGGGLLKRSLR